VAVQAATSITGEQFPNSAGEIFPNSDGESDRIIHQETHYFCNCILWRYAYAQVCMVAHGTLYNLQQLP
jgi:hypothetical protein